MHLGQVLWLGANVLVVFQAVGVLAISEIQDEEKSSIQDAKRVRNISNYQSSVNFNFKNKPRISRFPDPNDCSKFIYCVSGPKYPGFCSPSSCSPGLTFNPATSLCDLSKNGQCGFSTESEPQETSGMNNSLTISESSTNTWELLTRFFNLSALGVKRPNYVSTFSKRSTTAPIIALSQDLTPSSMGLLDNQAFVDIDNNIDLTSSTSIPPTTTTPKPRRLEDKFDFNLDCKSKHPCGLYPNTNGDCTTFYECVDKLRVTKRCHGGQHFDTRSLECREPSRSQCWTEPDSGPFTRSLSPPASCLFHQKTPSTGFLDSSGNGVLTNPLVTNWGDWQPWVICPLGSYSTGINVWRRLLQSGTKSDHAGVISISLNCQSPAGANRGFIESFAKGAPNDGWPKYYNCKGAGVGFRVNSQKYQGQWPNDNLAVDNVQLICSCGPPAYKPYELIPGPQTGNRGDWTAEQICRPREAVCGMQTQMIDYREGVIGSYDNRGLSNMRIKCCKVPNPASICKPLEKTVLVRSCENTLGIYPRRCDFQSSIGISYSSIPLHSQTINFHESIGFSIDNSTVDALRQNFVDNLPKPNRYEYNWEDDDEVIWQVGNSTSRSLYLNPGTKLELFQVIGTCDHLTVYTNRFFRNVTDVSSGIKTKEFFYV